MIRALMNRICFSLSNSVFVGRVKCKIILEMDCCRLQF